MTSQRDAFNFVVTVSFVLGKDNPRSLCDKLQPQFIRGATFKMVSVALMVNTIAQESIEYGLAVVEVLIQVEDEIVKLQLLGFPSGLPLRSAFLRGHIPWLVRAPTRAR